jgi:hypothetical protein
MTKKFLRTGLRAVSATALICGAAALSASSVGAATAGGYSIHWHAFVSGGIVRARSPCHRLSGVVAQAAVTPGITTSTNYTLFSGFLAAAPIVEQEQIFFDGFEDCKQ